MNARAAASALYLCMPHVRVVSVAAWPAHGWIWIRYCELCAMAYDDTTDWANVPRRGWRHFGLGEPDELEFDTWEAAMLSARDHLEAHRRALPAQIGES